MRSRCAFFLISTANRPFGLPLYEPRHASHCKSLRLSGIDSAWLPSRLNRCRNTPDVYMCFPTIAEHMSLVHKPVPLARNLSISVVNIPGRKPTIVTERVWSELRVLSLKVQLHTQLNDSGIASVTHLSEGSASRAKGGKDPAEICVIEDVKRFAAKLQTNILVDPHIFEQR